MFPKHWQIKPANEICNAIVDCVNKTAPIVDYDTEFKMIRTTNVKNGRIILDGMRCVEEEVFLKWNRRLTPKKGDVVLTREAPLGDVGLIRTNHKFFLGQRTMIYRADGINLNQRFLYYSLLGGPVQGQFKALGSGSTVEHIRVPDAEKISIPFPPISEQKKIAAILSAYDDLIENNKKRIQIVENIAEELYKEWFVRFRFPNWENTEFEKGIPKDWKIEKISNLVDRKKFGRVYKEFELCLEADIPVIDQSQKNILGFHEGEAEHIASFESPVIIFGDHSCKMQIMFKSFSLAENVIPFKSKHNISLLYLFSLIKDQVETTEYKRHWGELTNKKVLLAPLNLQEKYANLIIDKMKLIENLKMANNSLINSRDQLLPRLISGKLSVTDLDIQFPVSIQES